MLDKVLLLVTRSLPEKLRKSNYSKNSERTQGSGYFVVIVVKNEYVTAEVIQLLCYHSYRAAPLHAA